MPKKASSVLLDPSSVQGGAEGFVGGSGPAEGYGEELRCSMAPWMYVRSSI